jgi:hypothetical protein
MKRIWLAATATIILFLYSDAQHEKRDSSMGHMHDSMPVNHDMHDMDMDGNMNADHPMNHSYSRNLPMTRNGSGTGWLPDASPMYGYMFHAGKWMYMLHGNVFLRYNKQDVTNKGSRGAEKFDVPNWLMFMGQRAVGKHGLFHFSSMFSADAATGGNGYPLLFQSGESYHGNPIVDRQHPHDLFSELSVAYTQELSKRVDLYMYAGYPGEPALGPVAFMHRPSALDNPDAPLSHHWADATHITFGVATLGIRYNNFKLEGSSFTGREPDDKRFDFDKPKFDSWSGRLSYNPSANWALQFSHGFIKSPEALHPAENMHRTTASAIFSRQLANNNTVNATLLWGLNKTPEHRAEKAVLAEASWHLKKIGLYTRYEWVQKSTEELALDENVFGHEQLFPVNAFTIGFNYTWLNIGQTRIAAGAQGSLFHAAHELDQLYGANPLSAELYIRIYPGSIKM